MYQMAASLWNRVAGEQALQTPMANSLFRLSQDELDVELCKREAALKSEGYSADVIISYITLAPLLWENLALQAFVRDHPGMMAALPEVLTIGEAVMIAARDRSLDDDGKGQLIRLLAVRPV